MKKLFCVFLLLPFSLNAQNYLINLTGKTKAQLSGITAGETITNSKSYFDDKIFQRLVDLVDASEAHGLLAGSYTDLATAVDAANTDTALVIVHEITGITASARDTIPANVSTYVRKGGGIYVTRLLTINGDFQAGNYRVFFGNTDSVRWGVGAVERSNPVWFGAVGSDTSDDHSSLQSWIDAVEGSVTSSGEGWNLHLPQGTWYVSDTLLVQKHNIRWTQSGVLKPYGSYSGPLIHFKGQTSSRTNVWPDNNYLQVEHAIDGLLIDGLEQSKGVIFENIDHFVIENTSVLSAAGYAIKISVLREGEFINTTVLNGDAGSDSAMVWLFEESAVSGDVNNNIRFWGLNVGYNGGTAISMNNDKSGKERNIQFYAPQIHYLDKGEAWASLDTNIVLIKLHDAEKISFFGGNLRLGNIARGDIVEIGIPSVQTTDVNFFGTVFSANGDSVDAIRYVNADRINTESAIWDLNGTASNKGSTDSGSIYSDWYSTIYNIRRHDLPQGQDAVRLLTTNSGDTETPYLSFVEPNNDKIRRAKAGTNSLIWQIQETSTSNYKNFNLNADEVAFYVSNSDSIGNLGISNRRWRSIGFYPKVSTPSSPYKGQVSGSDESGFGSYGQGPYYYDGAVWLPMVSLPSGSASFSGANTADTVVVSEGTSTSLYKLEINDATPVSDDMLSYTVNEDTLFIHRVAGTTSGLSYSWAMTKRK